MIGIFDSGIGGLTVVREVRRQLPELAVAYLGDTARMPYGTKAPETVARYAVQDADFLLARGAGVLVVACHTISAVALSALRTKFPTVPILEVLTPALERSARATEIKRVGIIGTRATINSGVYQKELGGRGIHVVAQACPLLVPLIEEGVLDRQETKIILRRYLAPLREAHVDTLVLGCTHCPLLHDEIARRMGRRVAFIDPGASVAETLSKLLVDRPDLANQARQGRSSYSFTDVTERTEVLARAWLGEEVTVERVALPD